MQKYGISSWKTPALPKAVIDFALKCAYFCRWSIYLEVKKLKEIYGKYKDYAQTDVLMYLSFILFLIILFVFF